MKKFLFKTNKQTKKKPIGYRSMLSQVMGLGLQGKHLNLAQRESFMIS